jgi:acetyl esterase/lipase
LTGPPELDLGHVVGTRPRIVVVGESAGANLALSAAISLRESGERCPDALVLYYGAYDLSGTPSQLLYGDSGMVNSRTLPYFYSLYVSGHDARRPAISPLYSSMSGLPPTFLLVGTDDPLLDDTLFLHSRMSAHGVPVRLHIAPGGGHGFNHFPLAIADEAISQVNDFIESAVLGETA